MVFLWTIRSPNRLRAMNSDFYQYIYNKQKGIELVPPNERIAMWALELIALLYPERADYFPASAEVVADKFAKLNTELVILLEATRACDNWNHEEKAAEFFEGVVAMYGVINTDIEAILEGDPAARSRFEVIRAYPGFYAIAFYRIAHALQLLDIPLIPRILTEHAHSKTGIDIHPAAVIGKHFFVDHGTGVVIGETSIIGDHVKLYQGVTLGALSVDKSMAYIKRHPTVEDHVIIYSGATILGGNTTIGHHSIIGGNVWLTKSIPPYTTVYHKSEIEVVDQQTKI
jgi:serine O-acetyltransferase